MVKCSLNNLGSPTVLKRSRVRREYTTALRQESAREAIGSITRGCEIFGFTKGQFSVVDILEHLLNCTGPADVFICTWSVASADIAAVNNFLENGRIRSLRCLVDFSFQRRKPHFCKELLATFGPDAVRVTVTHAKYCLVVNEDWDLVLRTSMNLNWNARFENFEISDSREFVEFHQKIIDEIWGSQEAAEGFEVRPSENVKEFKRTFKRETSIFETGLTDARDIM